MISKDFIRYWAELRGTTLFLYANNKQEMHAEMIDLVDLNSLADFFPSDKQLTKVTLTLPNEEVQLKTETPEDVEEWKGFILTVTQLSVPSRLALLPGQIIRLQEVLEKERLRRASQLHRPVATSSARAVDLPDYIDVLSMPECFHQVTRKEAADLLEGNPRSGNLILRPGGDSKNFAVSIRQPTDKPIIKHYRVLNTKEGYTIELEQPVTLSSMDEVVEYFKNVTRGRLVPYISNMYDTQLEVLGSGPITNEASKKSKPQARVSPLVCLAPKKTEKLVKPEKPKKIKIPIQEDDPDSTYMNDEMPALQNISLGQKSHDDTITGNLGDELKDMLMKRREKMQLSPSQRTGANRKT
ncbi:signal-transducing adaptor protein 1 isoform X2 [Ambystoma mexicanum]|uniref:signal-transducing adaptor protein 1 isoform X2 n=1 Tax=Ambystoma mexicanum TaxID=8296 RepID=UPI0037E70097